MASWILFMVLFNQPLTTICEKIKSFGDITSITTLYNACQ